LIDHQPPSLSNIHNAIHGHSVGACVKNMAQGTLLAFVVRSDTSWRKPAEVDAVCRFGWLKSLRAAQYIGMEVFHAHGSA
jgi:hypothetical protein